MTGFLTYAGFALAMTAATLAHAGSSQSGAGLPLQVAERFSDQVQMDLAARGAHVAIVARAGRDPRDLPQGVTYTHVGLWVLSEFTGSDGRTHRGYRVWNLYQDADDPSRSSIVTDRPVDFIAGAKTPDAGIVIPKPELQRRLAALVNSRVFEDLHNPRYSVLANPRNNIYQNCTEHMVNLLMAAIYGTSDMAQIKANIAAYFPGQPIVLDPFSRALGPAFAAGVETNDHKGTIRTATFGSIARFLDHYDLAEHQYRLIHRPG